MESSDSSSSDWDTALPIFYFGPGQPVPKHTFPSSTRIGLPMDVETSENDELGNETWQPSSNHHDLDDDDMVPVPDIGNTDFLY